MGNDLMLATLAIPSGKEPDWEAARRGIARLSGERMEEILYEWGGEAPSDVEGELDLGAARKMILSLVDEVEEACKAEHRHLYCSEYVVPGWKVWITGGDSWGDSPSEEFDLFLAFLNATELAEAAGFATKFVG